MRAPSCLTSTAADIRSSSAGRLALRHTGGGPGGTRATRRGLDGYRARDLASLALVGRGRLSEVLGLANEAHPRIARRAELRPPRSQGPLASVSIDGSTALRSRVRTTSSICPTRGAYSTWLGTQTLKNPLDLWVYQEIVFETKPELIVETGTYRGGSALYLASLCDLSESARSCRSTSSPTRRLPLPSADHLPRRPLLHRPRVVDEVRVRVGDGRPLLVILDSDHSQAHVEAELETYAQLVPVGCYVIVEDSNIGQIRKDLMPGPLEAIETFLAKTDDFEIDREREKFLITFNPSGYLRRFR